MVRSCVAACVLTLTVILMHAVEPRSFNILLRVRPYISASKMLILTDVRSDNFDCGDWLLYVIASPRTGSGRGVSFGRVRIPKAIAPSLS
jgi:hypothetical protein